MKAIFSILILTLSYIGTAQKVDRLVHKADRNNWEHCELGLDDCKIIVLKRSKNGQQVFFILPKGGTAGTAYLSGGNHEGAIQTVDVGMKNDLPYFNLTQLKDGIYYASMVSCGLGGSVQIKLETKR